MKQPNNNTTDQNPVGRFMVAAGAVIKLKGTDKILLIRRSKDLDWQPNEWEILYGRIDQHEDLETGLRREIKEEAGITDLEVGRILSNWHIYRGEKSAHNDLIGLTFICETSQKEIKISFEHSEYGWYTPEEAVKMVNVEGIRRDVLKYVEVVGLVGVNLEKQ